MNKGKAATALAVAVALLAMGALAVLPQPERNLYGVHEVPATEEGAAMGAQEAGDGIDWDALPASVVAWVRVPGTTVDYPIVQGRPESPDFYLTHDAGGERSAWGAPYIDAGCAQGAESPLVIVYGHHMSDGTMFAPLAQYSSRGFAEGHRTIRVFTREKEIELEVFAADVVDASSEGKRTDFTDAAALDAYLGDKLSRCEVVLEEPSDVAQAWAFVTCSYQTSNSRTVVYAKEVEGGIRALRNRAPHGAPHAHGLRLLRSRRRRPGLAVGNRNRTTERGGQLPASSHITHLNTARNSQTKKPSVTLSAAMRNLPSLFIDVTPIFLDLAGALVGALFLLLREQPRQLVGHARDLRPPQSALQVPYLRLQRF